jgi:hypothetical protein
VVDRRRVRGGRRIGLRDATICVLRAVGMSPREISSLDGRDVIDHPDTGRLYVVRHKGGNRTEHVSISIPGTAERWSDAIVRDYLEAERLWGTPRPLFRGRRGRIAAATVKDLERRIRRQVGER